MKKFLKIAGVVLIPIYVAVFGFFVFPSLGGNTEVIPQAAKILQLWHTDLFEGGSGSRGDFLRQRAIEFENQNKGIYILVKTLTYEQMIYNLEQGNYPDIFSFGQGLGSVILPELSAFKGNISLLTNLSETGVIEDNMYGVPWCAGGYMIAGISEYIANTQENYISVLASSHRTKKQGMLYSFTTGRAMFNNPLMAAFVASDGMTLSQYSFKEGNYSQYDAYNMFTSKNESVFLLGTQRDAVRLSKRENSADFSMQALGGYTDLVCYLGVSRHSRDLSMCDKFIEYILGESSQSRLTGINMFSAVSDNLYTEGIMSEMEKLMAEHSVLNVFTDSVILLNVREVAMSALNGNLDSAKKIWEMLP